MFATLSLSLPQPGLGDSMARLLVWPPLSGAAQFCAKPKPGADGDFMRVLLTSPSPSERARFQSRLSGLRGVQAIDISADLTSAYHQAEHKPPHAAIFSEELSHLPEFEVMLALCQALRIRPFVLQGRNFGHKRPLPAFAGKTVTLLDDHSSDRDLSVDLLGAPRVRHDTPHMRHSTGSATPQTVASPNPGRIIMIGSSTGGVEALINVLATFTKNSPPVFIVQHTGASFSSGLARLLDARSPITVREAASGMTVKPGMAVLGPGATHHLELRMRGSVPTCRLVAAPDIGGHRPSVDALFRSGIPAASKVAAAILTGMGRDGAAGLLELKKAGARTFGQDQATSLVYGMPKVAAELNAVERQLPIDKIGPALIAASSEKSAA